MVDPQKHAHSRGIIESILNYIPGFHGYLQRDYRRESDHLARRWMADRLHEAKGGLDGYMRSLVDAGQLDALPSLERVRSRLDGLISQFRADVRGYSGFFDYVQVNEGTLDQVYEHDMALISQVEDLGKSMEQLAMKADTPQAVTTDLLNRIDSVESKFKERRKILEGIGPDDAGPPP